MRRYQYDLEAEKKQKPLHRLRNISSAFKLVMVSTPVFFISLLALSVLQSGIPALSLWFTKMIGDEAKLQFDVSADERVIGPMLVLFCAMLLVTVVGSVLQNLSTWLSEGLSLGVTDHVADLLHERGNRADMAHFESPDYYDKFHLAQQHAMHRPAGMASGMIDVIRGFFGLLVVGGVLAVVQWELLALLIAALIPGVWVRVRFSRLMRKWRLKHASSERRGYYLHYLQSIDLFAKEIRTFSLAGYLRKRYRVVRRRLRGSRLRMIARQARMSVVGDMIALIFMAAAFFLLVFRAFKGDLGMGEVSMLFVALVKSRGMLQGLLRSITRLYEDAVFLDHYHEFMELEDRVLSPDKPVEPPALRGELTFSGVGFHYPGSETEVLKNVSLKIPAGEHVALVGANGAGKTTLVKLLCRLYDPTSGAVAIDGYNLKKLKLETVRKNVSVLFQDFGRYQMTAAGNIGLGNLEERHSFNKIRQSAHRAGADQFIESYEMGYRTQLGRWFRGGTEISAGQWQRVALARALMADSPVLVMDEPTSALDASAEADLLERFVDASRGRTVLSISHRLLTVTHADRIIVMKDGFIVEDGCHTDLMAAGGVYYELFRRTSRNQGNDDEVT